MPTRKLTLLLLTYMALAVVVSFKPCVRNPFVLWDDNFNFLDNLSFRGLTGNHILWAWNTLHVGAYQPLSWMLFEAEYNVCGLDPRGYHLMSVVLHVVHAFVLYVLALEILAHAAPDLLSRGPTMARVSAALVVTAFEVHPLRVEVVAWASCQPYLPCAIFATASVVAYLRAQRSHSRRMWMGISWLLFAASLLSKAVPVSLPFVLLILDYYPLRRLPTTLRSWVIEPGRRVWVEKIPFFALIPLFMWTAFVAKEATLSIRDTSLGSLLPRLAQAGYGVWFYLAKTLVPFGITAYYPRPILISFWEPLYLSCALGVVAVTTVLLLIRARYPAPLAAWLTYLVMLAPNSGLIQIGLQIAADRYCFIPMTGLVLLAAGSLAWFVDGRQQMAAPALAGLLAACVALSALSQRQCRVWTNTASLWAQCLADGSAYNPFVRYCMGCAELSENRDLVAAERQFRQLEVDDENNPGASYGHVLSNAYYQLAMEYKRRGLKGEIPYFEKAIKYQPENVAAHVELAETLLKSGRLEEARATAGRALAVDEDYPECHYVLGQILAREKRWDEAHREFSETLRLDPRHARAKAQLTQMAGML